MILPLVFLAAIAAVFLHLTFGLVRNIQKARAIGLPYVLSPIHELELLAWITDPIIRWHCRTSLLREQGWPKWARFMVRDWHYEDQGRAHEEYGPAFCVVTPGGLVCYANDPDIAMRVATRRKAFIKPPRRMKLIEPFGPNVVSSDGDLWRFHIRTTFPAVGESLQKVAWEETQHQTDMLCQSWSGKGTDDVRENMYQLSLNIACQVIFGHRVDWQPKGDSINPTTDRCKGATQPPSPSDHRRSWVEALSTLTLLLPYVVVFPLWLLRLLPFDGARTACQTYLEVDQYMDGMLATEKHALSQISPTGDRRENLVTALLRSNNALLKENEFAKNGRNGFTNQEVKGNMFVFLLAGYETTANLWIYSCIMLAIREDIQEAVFEEVHTIYALLQQDSDHVNELSFSAHYPKFRYLVGFMHEMMRLFPIALAFTRELDTEETIKVPGGHEAILPRGSICVVNVTGSHLSPGNWPSPRMIEPKRWLFNNPNDYDPSSPSPQEEAESIPSHRNGTFLAFGEGPRACLGRRLARVEFVAFFSRMLRSYKVELEEGVDGQALERLIRCRGGGAPVSLNIPETVKLRLVPRII